MAVHRAVQMWMFLRLSASNAKAFLWREGWRRKCWKRCKCERHHKSQMKISHNFKCKSLAYNKKITPLPSPPSTTSLTQFPPTHTHINHMLNHQLDARVAGRGLKGEEVGQPPSSQTEAIVKVCGVVHFPSPHTHTLTASQKAGQRLNGRRDEVAHFLPLH